MFRLSEKMIYDETNDCLQELSPHFERASALLDDALDQQESVLPPPRLPFDCDETFIRYFGLSTAMISSQVLPDMKKARFLRRLDASNRHVLIYYEVR